MKDSKLIATTSPIEAARGVAKLSGFILYFFDRIITATKTKSRGRREGGNNKGQLFGG